MRERKKNKPDTFFENLISYQPNIKLIIEKNSAKVLDAEITKVLTQKFPTSLKRFHYSGHQKLLPRVNVIPQVVHSQNKKDSY